jgi:hypothetical protein
MQWRYLDAAGTEVGSSEEFADQDAAESWLGDAWRRLRDEGVEAVELTDSGEVLYGMGLGEDPS